MENGTNNFVAPGQHKLPPLPYGYDALQPIISSRTLRIHHDKHHQSYVDGLNKTELQLVNLRKKDDFEFIKYWENELAFNGSGHILHSLYWTIMAPIGAGGRPGIQTLIQINLYFGSFFSFQKQFSSAAEKVEASGWTILTWQPTWNRLEILQAEKHQNLTQWSGIPILVLDVWEHAYYLDYQNRRQEYINKWWQVVNWNEVERRLLLAIRGIVPMTMESHRR